MVTIVDNTRALSRGEEVIEIAAAKVKSASTGNPIPKIGTAQTPKAPLKIPATIPQSERLFTTRSRSVNYPGGGDRGQRAYIKLLTTDPTKSVARAGGDHDSKPTSLNSGSKPLDSAVKGRGYASFLITDISCSLDEKVQVVDVFGDAEVSYYFGRQPITFSFSGLLIDSVDNNWFIEWLEMYTHVLRGSQLARNYELIQLVLPNMTIVGTIPHTSWNQNSGRDTDIPFQFTFLAKQIVPTPVQLPSTPLSNDPVIKFDQSFSTLAQKGINAIKLKAASNTVKQLQAVIHNPLSTIKDYSAALSASGRPSLESGMKDLIPNAVSNYIDGLTDKLKGKPSDKLSPPSDLFAGATTVLTGLRTGLFSPVYTVLTSLTKLIKGVTGSLKDVIGSFTTPVRDLLRDIRGISKEAIGIVNLINNSIKDFTNIAVSVDRDIHSTLSLLKKTAGVITTAPETIGSSIQKLVHAGKMPLTVGFLTGKIPTKLSAGTRTNSKAALLNAGRPHTPERGAVI